MQRDENENRKESENGRRAIRGYMPTLASVAGGAGAGALLMYLMDPDSGAGRRHFAGDLARGAWRGTGEALHSAWDTAKDVGERAGAATSAGAAAARSAFSRSAEGVYDSPVARRLGRATEGFRDEASDRFDYLLRGRRSHGIESGTAQALAAVGCVALGLTTMYFFDGKEGARRRAVCRDQCLGGLRRLANSMRGMGRDLYNRAAGSVHSARSAVVRDQPDDRVIVERIRASIGHCVQNVGAVMVESHDGVVVLSGVVMEPEVAELLKCAWGVRGVRELLNRLEVRFPQTPEASTGPGATAGSVM
jgi:hypothetical protein